MMSLATCHYDCIAEEVGITLALGWPATAKGKTTFKIDTHYLHL